MAIQTVKYTTNVDNFKALQFVAVHNALATAQSSIDGRTFVSRTMPGAATNWMAVTYGDTAYNERVVAVSSGVMSAVSHDTISWYSGSLPAVHSWNAVAYGSGRFITIAGDTATYAYSTDGVSWTSGNLGYVADWKVLKFYNNKFIALAYNTDVYLTSYDGVVWTSGSMPQVANWSSMAYDSSLNHYVALAYNSGVIAHSDDGITWSGGAIYNTALWTSITSNNSGLFVAVAENLGWIGGYSQGGFTWSSGTLGLVSGSFRRVVYGPEENIFVAHSANTTTAVYSYDGIIWSALTQITGRVNDACYAPFSWRSADTFVINNNSVLSINTDQKKFSAGMTINNGQLAVTNTTSGAIRFITGRSTGIVIQSITPATGLGSVLVSGTMIDIGVGSGIPNQILDIPFRDKVASIWVERGYNSGVYDIWNNVLVEYGHMMKWPYGGDGGLEGVGTGQRGKFFTQFVNPEWDHIPIITGCSGVWGSRIITMPSTSGIFTGAQVSGAALQANTVVETIISATQISLNLPCSGISSNFTITVWNPFTEQLLPQIRCGDGAVHGNVFPSGAKIQIPNIMCTADIPVNLQTTSLILSQSVNLTNGASAKFYNCLWDEVCHVFTQATSLTIDHVGTCNIPIFIEVYDLNINSFGGSAAAPRRIYNPTWWDRNYYTRYAAGRAGDFAYITDAVINDVCFSFHNTNFIGAGQLFTITNTKNLTLSNIRGYHFFPASTRHCLAMTQVSYSTFTNLEMYGGGYVVATACTNNTYTNITVAESMFNDCHNYVAAARIMYDPVTGLDMLENQKYYFKVRSYYDKEKSVFTDGRVCSMTPFLGATLYPDNIGCNCNGSGSVVFNWTQRSPIYLYEVYRDTTPGFVTRDFTNKVYENATIATITWTNTAKTPAVATPVTDLWTWAAAGKTLTRSAGAGTSFLTLGYVVGDVVDITNTASNNGAKAITAVTATVMTFANVGTDVQTVVAEASSTSGTITARVPSNGNTYYYVFRKHDASGVYSECPEMEVNVSAPVPNTNMLLQSEALGTTPWTAGGITVTANNNRLPTTFPDAAIATSSTGDKLAATVVSGVVRQSITTVSGTQYTFSVYHRSDPYIGYDLISGFIGLSGSPTNFPIVPFVSSGSYGRSSVTITASGTSTIAVIGLNTIGTFIIAGSAQVNTGNIATAPMLTFAVPTTVPNQVRDISVLKTWCRSYGDETSFSGIEFTLETAPSGVMWTDVHCGTSGSFIPSITNKIFDTAAQITYPGTFAGAASDNTTIDTLTQVGRASSVVPLCYVGGSTKKLVAKNFTYDFGGWPTVAAQFGNIVADASDITFANYNLRNFRNYMAIYPFTTINTVKGVKIQNIRHEKSDHVVEFLWLDTVVKGLAGANATPANAATTYVFGSTTDGITKTYTAVYDTIFHELYFTTVSGCLHVAFNGSSKVTPPYTTVSGSPYFSNTGKLYFTAAGDSIEYTWPHKILGVSGFSDWRPPKVNTLDLGTTVDVGEALKYEYNLNTGSGYNGYKELNVANLGVENISASSGCYLKLKLTAMRGLKFQQRASGDFIVGERIRGFSSTASATVDRIFSPTANTGSLWLSNISGTFFINEQLTRDYDGYVVASGLVATNTLDPLFPSYNSYIDGLQIYTKIDQTVMYPITETAAELTLTGLQTGSEVRIFRTSDNYNLGGVASSSGSYTYDYVWDDIVGDVNVYIRIAALGYQWMTFTNQTLGPSGLIIPVQQQIDRQYNNPV